MWRLLAAIFILNVIFMITDYTSDSQGLNTATLTSGISAVSTTIPVNSTDGFASGNATITINSEDIFYTSKDATRFYTAVIYRGYGETSASQHLTGTIVYDPLTSSVNRMLNYDITTTETGGGAGGTASSSVISVKDNFWTSTLPNFFLWNYNILNSNAIGQVIRFCLMGICGILTAIIAINMLPFIKGF